MRLWAIRNIGENAKALDRQGARLLMLGDLKIIVGISTVFHDLHNHTSKSRGNQEDTLVCMKTMI